MANQFTLWKQARNKLFLPPNRRQCAFVCRLLFSPPCRRPSPLISSLVNCPERTALQPTQPAQADRIVALDFVKGVLILLMIVYHWGNYFIADVPGFYEVLRFLTPSFILITGAVIGLVYATRYASDHSRAALRLGWRGLKLLVIFTALNLVLGLLEFSRVRGGNSGVGNLWTDWFAVYVSGNSSRASFRVLLPISYLLLLSGAYLFLANNQKRWVAGGVLLLGLILQWAEFSDWTSANLALLSFGFLGLATEMIGLERISRASAHLPVLILGYMFSVAAMLLVGPIYTVQVLETAFALLLIYGIGRRVSMENGVVKHLVLLGRYSLFAYVFQIAILQFLAALAKHLPAHPGFPPVFLLAGIILTMLLVLSADRLRRASAFSDAVYRAVFA